MRRTIVPSENPASTSSIIESFVSAGVFSNFSGAPASEGGRIIRTVAVPVVTVSPDWEAVPPRVRTLLWPLPLEPKMFASRLLIVFCFVAIRPEEWIVIPRLVVNVRALLTRQHRDDDLFADSMAL